MVVAGVAVGSTPVGTQGVDIAGTNSNSVGIDLNYLDTSSTTNMQATSTSGPWAAIGVALLPLQITIDASCTATGASATTLSCSLNRSNNVLIVIWAGNDGSDTVSGVTVAGNSATLFTSQANATAATIALFYYYASAAANDSVVATYTNHNNNESLAVYSLLGTTSTAPFFNTAKYAATTNATYCGAGEPATGGETNRLELQGTEINSAVAVGQGNGFDATYVTCSSGWIAQQLRCFVQCVKSASSGMRLCENYEK